MNRYFLTNTGYNSSRYGVCEVCKAHCSETWIQVEQRYYSGKDDKGWTEHNCHSLFGHKECLTSKQKPDSEVYNHTSGYHRLHYPEVVTELSK